MGRNKAILCDIDGTLALISEMNPFDTADAGKDALNHPVANLIEVYARQKIYEVDLILITGREEQYRQLTEDWLESFGITHYKHLYMRPNGDYRKDFTVKREIYLRGIKPNYDILFVLEDRTQVVKMWRAEGLTCFQVAEGDF